MKEKIFERKNELLKAALDEFSSKSYDIASLNMIIKNAKISKGTFYYHFADKEELYLYLVKSAFYEKWDFINKKSQTEQDLFNNGSIFEKFKLQAKFGAEFALKYPLYYKLGNMLSKENSHPIYEKVKLDLNIDTHNILNSMIDEAISKGEIRNDFPRDFLVKTLSYLFSSFDRIFNSNDECDLDDTLSNLDMYFDLIQNGIENKKGGT